MENPSGLQAGTLWAFSTGCDHLGVSYSQVRVMSGPWALAFFSRNFAGETWCGIATGSAVGLIPGKTYKVYGWWNGQGTSRNLTVAVDGGVGTIGTISGVTADPAAWQGFAFSFVAKQVTHAVSFTQLSGSSSTGFTRYLDNIGIAPVVHGVTADLESLSPAASGESLAPTASPSPDTSGGEPGYGG